jgi:hypothetical protein
MAAFGFSIGDFFAVGQLAWSVYKSCKRPSETRLPWRTELITVKWQVKEPVGHLKRFLMKVSHLPASQILLIYVVC